MRARLCSALSVTLLAVAAYGAPIHVWEKQEITLTAARDFRNPYTDATVWVDLEGPEFRKRVYGFWDGGKTFRVRILATKPGVWRWRSGSEPRDAGLAGKTGSFTASPWTEAEKKQNPLRRGFPRATANGHALEHADGTPFFVLGDSWYGAGTSRFRWYDDERQRAIGPEAGFKDYVRLRKTQGYNWINILAAFPNWHPDGLPFRLYMNDADHTTIRAAWLEFGTGKDARTGSAKNMSNEGGRPFLYPGKVPGFENVFPDMDRINPDYFRYLDRKVDYLNEQGFVVFIEAMRRDASECWKKYYAWPDSYVRFVQYIFARYQANNAVLSPVHLDILLETIPVPDYQEAIGLLLTRYGPPPFGTLLSANAHPSTLTNWGNDSWVTLHQTGNRREHDAYWYLSEIFREPRPKPALNGEPYYSGYADARGINGSYKLGGPGNTAKDDRTVRSGMYGGFLSGSLAGHVYGAEGIWGADIEPAAPVKMWDAFRWNSGALVALLAKFALSAGKRYQELVPDENLVIPSRTASIKSFEGWAYAARTPDRQLFMAYFEAGCPKSQLRGLRPMSYYRAHWFNPRDGAWIPIDQGLIKANGYGETSLPPFPDADDWGLQLVYSGPAPMPKHF